MNVYTVYVVAGTAKGRRASQAAVGLILSARNVYEL
jgi:hypothetical protein